MNDSDLHTQNKPLRGVPFQGRENQDASYGRGGYDQDSAHQYSRYQTQESPAEMAINWAKQHPLMCAAAVAAVVVIGPRKVMRTVGSAMASGGVLSALTLRNPSNVDALARLISVVGGYLRQNSVQKNTDRARYRP